MALASPAINSDPDAAYTENQAATFLGVTVRTLQSWRVSGIGPPYVKVSRTVRYQRRALVAFMEERTVSSVAEANVRETGR
jgi:hypothetical protein